MKVKTYENKRKSSFPRKSYVPRACARDNNNEPEEFDKIFEDDINTGKTNISSSSKCTTFGAKSKTISKLSHKRRKNKLKKLTLFEDKSSDGSITSFSSSALKNKYSRTHTGQIFSSAGSYTGKIVKPKYKYESSWEKERRKRRLITSNWLKKSNLLGVDSYKSELFGDENKTRNKMNRPEFNVFTSTAIGKSDFEKIKARKIEPNSRVNREFHLNISEMSFSDFLPGRKFSKMRQKSNVISADCPSFNSKYHLNTPNKENFDNFKFMKSPIANSTPTDRPKQSVFLDRANIIKSVTPSKRNLKIDKSDALDTTYVKLDSAKTAQKMNQTGCGDNSEIRSYSLLVRKIATPTNKTNISQKKYAIPNEIDASNAYISAEFDSSPNFVTAGNDSLLSATPIKPHSVTSKTSGDVTSEKAASNNHPKWGSSFSKISNSPYPNVGTRDMARISVRTKFSSRSRAHSKRPNKVSSASMYFSKISSPPKLSKIISPSKFTADMIESAEFSTEINALSKISGEISSPPILSKISALSTDLRTSSKHLVANKSPPKLSIKNDAPSKLLKTNATPSEISTEIRSSSKFVTEISSPPKLYKISALSKQSTKGGALAKHSNDGAPPKISDAGMPFKLSTEISAPPKLSNISTPLKYLTESAIPRQSIEICAQSKLRSDITTPPQLSLNNVTHGGAVSLTPRISYHVEQSSVEEIDESDYSPDLFYTSRKRAEWQRRQSFRIAAPHFDDSMAENCASENRSAHSLDGSKNDDNIIFNRPSNDSLRSFGSLDVTGVESPRSYDQSLPYLVDANAENKYNNGVKLSRIHLINSQGGEMNESLENVSRSDENILRTEEIMKSIVKISSPNIENDSTNCDTDELTIDSEGSLSGDNISHTEELMKSIVKISSRNIENDSTNYDIDELTIEGEGSLSGDNISHTEELMKSIVKISSRNIENDSTNCDIDELTIEGEGSLSGDNISRTEKLTNRFYKISESSIDENVSANSNIDELSSGNESVSSYGDISHTRELGKQRTEVIFSSCVDENVSTDSNTNELSNANERFTSYDNISHTNSCDGKSSISYIENNDELTRDNENISANCTGDNYSFRNSRNNELTKSIESDSSESPQNEDLAKYIENLSENLESFQVDTIVHHSKSRLENIPSTNAQIDELTKSIENLSTNCVDYFSNSRIENIFISDLEIEGSGIDINNRSTNHVENVLISASQIENITNVAKSCSTDHVGSISNGTSLIEDITKGFENLSTGYDEKASEDLTNGFGNSGSVLYLPHGKRYRRSIINLKSIIENPSVLDLGETRPKGKNYLKNLEFLVSNQLSSNNLELFGSVREMACTFAEKSINELGNSSKYESFFQSFSNSRYSFGHTAKRGARFSLTSKPVDQITNATKLSEIEEQSEEDEEREEIFYNPDVSRINCLEPRELVLKKCGQTDVLPFEEVFPAETLRDCKKIGEGVYGEVFKLKRKRNHVSIVKIIPIEGDQLVNEEKQKTFEEISSEIIITTELSNLKYGRGGNMTTNFVGVQNCFCVKGAYPKKLIDLWNDYDENVGSDNDSPKIFTEDQLFIIFELDYGGTCVESFPFTSALQSYSALQQTILGLAVAEAAFQFEHRDLHLGNILLSKCRDREIAYTVNGEKFVVRSHGVKVTIIDFTLSRISYNGKIFFNNLATDPMLFVAQGDFQFEVYRLMQREVDNFWDVFAPKTHIFWLRYLVDKLLNVVEYKRKSFKTHLAALNSMRNILDSLDDYESALHLTSIFRI